METPATRLAIATMNTEGGKSVEGKLRIFLTALLAISLTWLGGCVQTKTTPGYARAGDSVVIGLGGINRNAAGEQNLRKEDLTISITDSSSANYVLEPSFLFKSYPDYNAKLNSYTFDGTDSLVGITGLVPFDGGWFAVVPLSELPQGAQTPVALPLVAGPATISVTSPKLTNTGDSIEGDLTAIPIDILPGTSAPDADFLRQFVSYEPGVKNFVVSPDNLTGVDAVGGGYFVIDYSDDTFFQGGQEPIVVPIAPNPYVQMNYNVVSNGDGTGSIYVVLLNPQGFKPVATADPNSSFFSDLPLRLVYFSNGTAAQAKANFSLDAASSYYIGMDGSTLAGVSPVMTHAEDL